MTPQPIKAASSSGISFLILTMAFSCTSICSAKDDRLRNWFSFSFLPHDRRFEAPGIIFTVVSVHSTGRPVVQLSQVPQNTERHVTTWSPGLTELTAEATFSTIPA